MVVGDHGWVLGSTEFVTRLGQMVRNEPPRELHREARLARGVPLEAILEVVCRTYGVESSELSRRGSRHEARAALAYLARRHTVATNASLAEVLGVSRPDSVPNLTRRFARWLTEQDEVRQRHKLLEDQLRLDLHPKKPQTRSDPGFRRPEWLLGSGWCSGASRFGQ